MATALMATEIVNDEILNSSLCGVMKNREKMRGKNAYKRSAGNRSHYRLLVIFDKTFLSIHIESC